MRVTLFEYMVVISVSLNFPYPARVTLGKASEWARLPSAKECFLGGARKKFERRCLPRSSNLFWEEPRPRRGAVSEAERRRAEGRRFGPEAVTEQRTGYEAEDSHWTQSDSCNLAAGVRLNRNLKLLVKAPELDGLSHLPLRSSRLAVGSLKAFGD